MKEVPVRAGAQRHRERTEAQEAGITYTYYVNQPHTTRTKKEEGKHRNIYTHTDNQSQEQVTAGGGR